MGAMAQPSNQVFLDELYKSFGKDPNDLDDDVNINIANFAPNNRMYDVSNTGSLAISGLPNIMLGTSLNNVDTAFGLPWLYENLYVGKAIYALNCV